jgi:hypothetical protein
MTMQFSESKPAFTEPKPRMTDAQRDKLWDLCGRYGVPFREDDYFPTRFSSSAPLMFEGWIGGTFYNGTFPDKRRTIYIGVEPNGDSHS